MVSLGYKQIQGDHSLFIKHSLTCKLPVLLVYVDDIIIVGDDEPKKSTLKEKLTASFGMTDLRELTYLFGIEVAYSKSRIFISQRNMYLIFSNK